MYTVLFAIMILASAALAGLFTAPLEGGEEIPTDPSEYLCCDTGDGANCHPAPGKNTVFNSRIYGAQEYGLLKSDIYLANIVEKDHLDPVPGGYIDGQPVFLNIMPGGQSYYPEKELLKPGSKRLPGCFVPENENNIEAYKRSKDWVNDADGCYEIPNDMLIYKCRADSPQGACTNGLPNAATARFDVYIRLSDIPGGNVSTPWPFLTKCTKPQGPKKGEQMIVFRPSPGGQENLQLRTFKFIQPKSPAAWISPWCKPAIYLYPERKAEVNVSVFPQGKMLLTIPPYPKTGWDVIAEPNGNIHYQNNIFDYLYYEASLPDQLITKPTQGYVIAYDERARFLAALVTKLGLNEKETKQFVAYWTPILPQSPYYFVGVVPERTLHELSPLLITPKPDTTIRVTLYFQALEKNETVSPPVVMPIKRNGFTAVEWGGIFKQDKDHPFSCFM